MKEIVFIRTAPYSYQLPQKSLYQSLDEIGLQVANPHLSKISSETKKRVGLILFKHKPGPVFCSELDRSQETARLFSKKKESVSQLNEIKFSMGDFSDSRDLPTDRFDKEKINILRHKFSQSLLNNKLQEKQKSIIKRLMSFKRILNNTNSETTILCCSHGFIMKLYENLFLSSCGTDDFRATVSMYDWMKPPFGFLDGFVVSCKKDLFRVESL